MSTPLVSTNGRDQPYVLEVAVGDRWPVVRQRLRWAGQGAVVVRLLPGQTAFQELVSFQLLRREAVRLGLAVAVVSLRGRERSWARSAGLPAFGRLEEGARAHQRGRLAAPDPRSLPLARAWRQRRAGGSWRAGAWTAALVALTLLGPLGLLLPQAEITLEVAARPLEETVILSVDPAAQRVDPAQFILPGRRAAVTVQGSAQAPTLASRDAPDAAASGEVVFINRWDEPASIPAGTLVRASAGTSVRFATQAPLELPAERGARGVVPIRAVDPGPAGNVPPLTINQVEGPLSLRVAVTNEAPTQGGSARSERVVTVEDHNRLRQILQPRLEHEARRALEISLEEGELLLSELFQTRVMEEVFSHAPNQPADSLGLQMRLRAEAVSVRSADLQRWAEGYLAARVPAQHVLETGRLEAIPVQVRAAQSQAQLEVLVRGWAIPVVHPDRVRTLVSGLPREEAARRLEEALPLAAPPRLELRHAWLGRLPLLPLRISVEIRGPSAGEATGKAWPRRGARSLLPPWVAPPTGI